MNGNLKNQVMFQLGLNIDQVQKLFEKFPELIIKKSLNNTMGIKATYSQFDRVKHFKECLKHYTKLYQKPVVPKSMQEDNTPPISPDAFARFKASNKQKPWAKND